MLVAETKIDTVCVSLGDDLGVTLSEVGILFSCLYPFIPNTRNIWTSCEYQMNSQMSGVACFLFCFGLFVHFCSFSFLLVMSYSKALLSCLFSQALIFV